MERPQQASDTQAGIVQRLLERKRNQTELVAPLSVLEALYPQYEAAINARKQYFPRYALTGGIHYLMSLEEITALTKARLEVMYHQGRILTEAQFEKLNKEEWFPRLNNLTRIWGAEFLQKGFEELGYQSYKVPEYIIVVKDLKNIQITLSFNDCFPIAFEILNGQIYAKKIVGKPIANTMGRSGIDSTGLGYTDYSAASNILETKDGSKYFVDTEYKSFYDGTPGPHFFQNKVPAWLAFCNYINERFKLIHNIDLSALDTIITVNLLNKKS